MEISYIVVGDLETNCYVVSKNGKCLIVDPGDNANDIISYIEDQPVGVLITHNHDDHIGALSNIKEYYNINSYDFHNLKEGINTINEFVFDVIYTPGHKEDSICFYFVDDNSLFSGDFIFEGSIGRTDLPGGSWVDMKKSIDKIMKVVNDDTIILPGHGPITIYKNEIDTLNFFKNRD